MHQVLQDKSLEGFHLNEYLAEILLCDNRI
jgi:hypothetical protein